ncbi:MAG: hypothetical protein JOZ69_23765 [Myxococcales bacterium]|nr:hypothetical protein [Myxococcales bacterium]
MVRALETERQVEQRPELRVDRLALRELATRLDVLAGLHLGLGVIKERLRLRIGVRRERALRKGGSAGNEGERGGERRWRACKESTAL